MSSSLLRCVVPRVLKRSLSLSSANRTAITIDPDEVARFANVLKKEERDKQVDTISTALKSIADKKPSQGQLANVEELPLKAELLSAAPVVDGMEAELDNDPRLASLSQSYESMGSLVKKLPSLDLKTANVQDKVKALAKYNAEAVSVLEKFRENETAFFKVVDEIVNEKLHPYIGKREVVTHTCYGQVYIDTHIMPYPGVRYKEFTPEILSLREKEKGSWKDLTVEEKKILYRASFRKTLEENNEELKDTGNWKYQLGMSFLVCWVLIVVDCLFELTTSDKEYFTYLRSPIVAEIVAEEMAQRGSGRYESQYDLENMRWK